MSPLYASNGPLARAFLLRQRLRLVDLDWGAIVGQALAALGVLVGDPSGDEVAGWIAEMILRLQGGGAPREIVRARPRSQRRDRDRLRLLRILPIGVDIDGRKHRAARAERGFSRS